MDDDILLKEIDEMFGIYKRPSIIEGFPEEPWQKRLTRLPLERISEVDLVSALHHIFPGHYGNVNVFRYLLRRCLYESFWVLKLIKQFREIDLEKNKPIESFYYYSEIREITPQRCIIWKPYLKQSEIQLLSKIFWRSFQKEYDRIRSISPFYFNVLLLWEKEIPDCHRLGSNVEPALDVFKIHIRKLLEPYIGDTKASPLMASMGKYMGEFYNGKINEYTWNDLSDDMAMSPSLLYISISKDISHDDIQYLNDKIVEYFL